MFIRGLCQRDLCPVVFALDLSMPDPRINSAICVSTDSVIVLMFTLMPVAIKIACGSVLNICEYGAAAAIAAVVSAATLLRSIGGRCAPRARGVARTGTGNGPAPSAKS